jgi:hypothetical protein
LDVAIVVLRVIVLVLVVLAINASIPYLSWLLGSRFFGDDPGRDEPDWRRRFLKRALRGLLLMSRFGRGFLPTQDNPFRKFDRHSTIFSAAVFTVFVALLLFGLVVNRLR